ncbi:MAG: hypothetical protein JJT78_14415 [Leptospira sp.]|nr:hypothetical protein [Leptospira sp.]
MIWAIIGVLIGVMVLAILILNAQRKKIEAFVENHPSLKGAEIFDCAMNNYIMINENGYIGLKGQFDQVPSVFHIKDILGFELKTNGKSSASIGGAVAGGLLFGGLGALLGATSIRNENITELTFVFKINDFKNPNIEIKMLDGKTKKDSMTYNMKQKSIETISSKLEIIEKKFRSQ